MASSDPPKQEYPPASYPTAPPPGAPPQYAPQGPPPPGQPYPLVPQQGYPGQPQPGFVPGPPAPGYVPGQPQPGFVPPPGQYPPPPGATMPYGVPMAPQFAGPQPPSGYNVLDAFQTGNVIQLISKLTNKPLTCIKGATNANGAFGKDNGTFTVVVPKGAAQGVIMLHNTVSTGLYLSVNKGGFFNVGKGRKWSHLQPMVQPDNSVSFKSMEWGGLLCFNQKGMPFKASSLQDPGSQFYIRIERQTGVYSQIINTPFGRPSIGNQFRTDCLVQLYLKPFNQYLSINKTGAVVTVVDGNNTDTCLKLVDRGMGVFSFESNKYKLMRFVMSKGILTGKGIPDRNADFQLKENPDGTACFESVGTPGSYIGILGGGSVQTNLNVAIVVVTGVGKSQNIAKTLLN